MIKHALMKGGTRTKASSSRNINFEILRNVAMLFIVIYHILYHGVQLKETIIIPNLVSVPNFIVSQYLLTVCSICVNLYVLITGYFMFDKSFKSIRFLKVWFLAVFYGLIITATIHFFNPEKVSLLKVVSSLRPIGMGNYWFVKQYLGLLIASPLLGYVATTITKKQFKILLIVFFILGTNFTQYIGSLPFGDALVFERGFSFIWFVCLFFTGAYIRRFGFRYSSFKYFFILSLLVCLYTVGRVVLFHFLFHKNLHFFNYDYNGFPYLLAVLFFSWIKNHHFKENALSNLLVKMAPYTFAVYLIHDNKFIRSYLYSWGGVNPDILNSAWMIPHIIIFSLLVFLVCILIDVLRERLFVICRIDKLQNNVSTKIDKWIFGRLSRLN